MENTTQKLKRWNSIFCRGMVCKTNLKRDIVITGIAILLAVFIIGGDRYFYANKIQSQKIATEAIQSAIQDPTQAGAEKQPIDTTSWKTYKDSQYDFEIRYPDSWAEPQAQAINNSDFVYQYQVKFGTNDSLNGNGNEGYSVFVSKKTAADTLGDCINQAQGSSNSASSQQGGNNSQCLLYKLKVPGVSSDYHSYQFISGEFEFNLLPTLTLSDSSQLSTGNITELDSAADTFTLDFEAIKNKTAEQLKKQQQQQAAAARIALINAYPSPTKGTPVCPDIHSKPTFSATKSKHIDEDCCPDPDEWPNLRCRYKPSDFNIMLKGLPPQKLLR